MSIKQTEIITQSTIRALDDSLWKEIALKAINKMPKIQLTQQSNKLFHDFALMNGHDSKSFLYNLAQQNEKKQTINDNLLIGGLKTVVGSLKHSQEIELPSQSEAKEPIKLKFKANPFAKTQIDSTLGNSQVPKACTQLFPSRPPNEEELIQAQLRKTKIENLRYNQRLQSLHRERTAKSQHHSENQKRKLKQTKFFTYDYEGKLLGTRVKENGNMKFVHLKSKFSQSNKEHRSLIQKLNKSKCSQITDKKVINPEANDALFRQQKANRNTPAIFNNSINDLFRDDRSIEMGVSIIDKTTNSKLIGKEKNLNRSIKLSDFKRSFKSSSMVARKKHQKLATIQPSSPNLSDKEFARVNTVSDVESKIISSALSRYSKQLGKISINNNKAFMESFYNDHS